MPVFDNNGVAIGVLKISGNRPDFFAAALPDHIPLWLLDLIENGLTFQRPVLKKGAL